MNQDRDQPPTSSEDQKIDDAVEDSFPASDPPSNTPETGVQPRHPKSQGAHRDARKPEEEKPPH